MEDFQLFGILNPAFPDDLPIAFINETGGSRELHSRIAIPTDLQRSNKRLLLLPSKSFI